MQRRNYSFRQLLWNLYYVTAYLIWSSFTHINTNSRVAEWLNFVPIPNSAQIFIISFTILEQLEVLQGHKQNWFADNGLIEVAVLFPLEDLLSSSCYNMMFERKNYCCLLLKKIFVTNHMLRLTFFFFNIQLAYNDIVSSQHTLQISFFWDNLKENLFIIVLWTFLYRKLTTEMNCDILGFLNRDNLLMVNTSPKYLQPRHPGVLIHLWYVFPDELKFKTLTDFTPQNH